MKKYTFFILSLLLSLPLAAQTDEDFDTSDGEELIEGIEVEVPEDGDRIALNAYKFGNGLRFASSTGNRYMLDALVQSTAETKHAEGVDEMYNRFRVRRARVGFRGQLFHDLVRFRFQLDLVKGSETDSDTGSLLMDALVSYRPFGNKLVVSFGQTSTPTDNVELQMSSHTLQFVERSKITSAFSTIRELGLFVESNLKVGQNGVVRPVLAITDGDGPVTHGKRYGGFKYGGRLEYLPFGNFRAAGRTREADMAYEVQPKVKLGVAYSYNDGVSDRRGGRSSGDILYKNDAGEIKLPDMAKFVADLVFKYRGFSLLGEYAKTWAHVPQSITQRVRNDGSSATTFEVDGVQNVDAYIRNRMMLGEGFNLQGGYMLRSLWSFDVRYTHLHPDKYSYMNNNLYFNRHNFYDFSISKYLTRNYSVKVQATFGMVKSAGENRTPDSAYTYNGYEYVGNMIVSFKF